ncbi:unnamed protein product [Penicillium roqueforti FM164]|uniref:Genomic scaffold, ProqFM164S02 n=1 Tax=Penicillium roqueforti (strain FM164) TaxID=1365484 RepID=W6Q4C4_PENRF|nr:unnamed protein product [Penicillium roqueforti FM164]
MALPPGREPRSYRRSPSKSLPILQYDTTHGVNDKKSFNNNWREQNRQFEFL